MRLEIPSRGEGGKVEEKELNLLDMAIETWCGIFVPQGRKANSSGG